MLKWLRKSLPNKSILHKYKVLRMFGSILHQPKLWKLRRNTLAKGAAIGLFVAFIPFPAQMLVAALLAVAFSANLPIAVVCVWLTNPITIPPLFYLCYKVGSYVLASVAGAEHIDMSRLHLIWKPFLLGSFIVGTALSIIGYITVYILSTIFLKVRARRKH